MSQEPIQTRRQIAYSRHEREQLRLIYLGLGIVAGLIALVFIYGFVQTYYIEPNSAVATVNGTDIIVRDYRDRVRYERFLLEEQYNRIVQQRQELVDQGNEQFVQFYDQLANQVLQQRSVVDQQTLDLMLDDRLLEAQAAAHDVTVSENEITEEINRFLASRIGGLTEAAASETVESRAAASATAEVWTPTPTWTPQPTLTTTADITPTATPADTPTPGPTPTLNVIAAGELSSQYNVWLNTLQENADIEASQYRNFVRLDILRDKMRQVIGEEAPRMAEQAHARHILISTAFDPPLDEDGEPIELSPEEQAEAEEQLEAEAKQTADELVERLKNGADFAELAEQFSDDPGSRLEGGDLGFVTQGTFVAPVDEAVFGLPIGEISEPIQSQFGWHIIEVLERAERELSAADYTQAQRDYYNDWLTELRADAEVEDYWTPDIPPEDTFFNRAPTN